MMSNLVFIGVTLLFLALAFFFFRMRAVARRVDDQCMVTMNIALSLLVVIPSGLGVLAAGMHAWNKSGADMVILAAALSLAGGLILIPLALSAGLRRLQMTEEEKERDLFN